MKTVAELLLIKESCKTVKDFNQRWEMEKPLRQWANDEFVKAANLVNIKSTGEMKNHLAKIDAQAFRVSREEFNKLCVLFEDERIKVVAWIDYDLDTTLAKYSVLDKASKMQHNDMIDIEHRYSTLNQTS